MSEAHDSDAREPVFAQMEAALDALQAAGLDDDLPPNVVQRLFTIAVRNYSRCYEEDPSLPPLIEGRVNATEVSNSCLEMLRVVDMQLFELTFWGGRLGNDQS